MASALPQLTRDEIAHLVSLGHVLVLKRRQVFRLNSWLARHPGGHLAILHFVGRDASNEIDAYHGDTTLKMMRSFVVAEVAACEWHEESTGWKPLLPPVQASKTGEHGRIQDYGAVRADWKADLQRLRQGAAAQQVPLLPVANLEPQEPPAQVNPAKQYSISKSWEGLHEQLVEAGLYEASPAWNYRADLARYLGLFAAFLWVFLRASETWHYYAAAVLLGACWHQVTFAVHDADHVEITGNYHKDRVIGCLIASWFGGLSAGWWADNHNIHHLVTNDPEHDPDIQHVPFFAISPKFFGNLYSSYYRRTMWFDVPSRFFVAMQHKLYYLVMSLARFNLFANSYQYLLFKAKPDFYRNLELAGVAFFWLWFGGGVLRSIPDLTTRLGFLVVCFMVTSPLHVQITLSHFAQSTEDLGVYESFPARQLRTTMDVTCPEYMEWMHGGLNMQVTHHLFPRIPRHNLRKATAYVQEWTAQQGLEYQTYHFVEGNQRVLSVLRDVANQVDIMGKVAAAQARGEMHRH